MIEISRELEWKWKKHLRLLISYNDFKHASDMVHYYINGNYDVNREEWEDGDYYERKIIGEALSCGVIVSYARPFSGNDKKVKERIPDLHGKYLRLLDEKEKNFHKLILSKRNKEAAHSDSDSWDIVPYTLTHEDRKMIFPAMNDVFAPLSIEEMNVVSSNCGKFMDAIIIDRKELEPELLGHFHEIGVWNEESG